MTERDEARWSAVEEGAELLQEGEYEAASRELTRVAASDPQNVYAWFFLGHAHYEQQALSKALAAYLRALELVPEHLGARIAAGHTLRMMGKLTHALRMANHALASHPNDGDALYLLGLVQAARGETEAAIDALRRFLTTGPEPEVVIEVQGLLQSLTTARSSSEDDDLEED